MKKLLTGFTLAGALCCWLLSCNKSTSTSSTTPGVQRLSLSAQLVKQGQPLIAALPQGVCFSSIKWVVSPDSAVRITMSSQQANILFLKAGDYTVSAVYVASSDSAHRDSCNAHITVSDSVYTPPPSLNYDTVAVAGDTLSLTPIADTNHSLTFIAQSFRHYGCFPYFIWSMYAGVNSGISLQFPYVIANQLNSCGGAAAPAVSFLPPPDDINNWPNGAYPFSVTYSGTTYTGSLTITSTDYTFTWPYSTGVVISPLHVVRK